MTREVGVAKTYLRGPGRGKRWIIAKAVLPIRPDDMERLVVAAKKLTGVKLDWIYDSSQDRYLIEALLYPRSLFSINDYVDRKLEEVRECLDWLDPLYKSCRQKVEKEGLRFRAVQS